MINYTNEEKIKMQQELFEQQREPGSENTPPEAEIEPETDEKPKDEELDEQP